MRSLIFCSLFAATLLAGTSAGTIARAQDSGGPTIPTAEAPLPQGQKQDAPAVPNSTDLQLQRDTFGQTPGPLTGGLTMPGTSPLSDAPLTAFSSRANTLPKEIDDENLAMTYYRLAYAQDSSADKKGPDFKVLAREMKKYQEADSFHRTDVLNSLVDEMRSSFDAIVFNEPIALRLPVHLSGYSEKSQGFVIPDLGDQVVMRRSFAGQNFAIIPRQLADYQFMSVAKTVADAIGPNTGAKTQYKLVIYLSPDFADPIDKLTEMPGAANNAMAEYHVMSGKVNKVQLWDDEEKVRFWDSADSIKPAMQDVDDESDRQKFLRLKQ
jgi:hypothetical protein